MSKETCFKKFKDWYENESGQEISDELAMGYFEALFSIIAEVTDGVDVNSLLKEFKNKKAWRKTNTKN